MDVHLNYIGGHWQESASRKTTPDINPADRREVICEAQASNPEDVERAVLAASEAFPVWSRTPAPLRAEILDSALRLIEQNAEQFARAITLENGKTLRESRSEVASAIKEARFQIGQGRRLGGRQLPSDQPGVSCYLTRVPVGVAAIITPWNFPINVACRKIFPALVAGNCCVLKPADFTPMTAVMLVNALHMADLPAGVVNLVTGQGSVIGEALVTHPAVCAVSFTGSTDVGLDIARKLAGSQTKVQLEMGGKNPLVILADADLEAAVESVILGAYGCAGQWCTSTSRVILEQPVYDAALEMIADRAKHIRVGNGLDESVDMGPVAGPRQFESILEYIGIGMDEGARLCVGGRALNDGENSLGYFIEPTVFADVTPDMRIAREEIFGPVLSVMRARDFDNAISIANDTIYGLTSSIYTKDISKAQRFIQESRVGMCHVNMPTSWKEPQLEFGGIKESGRGLPEAGETGALFFTEHKAVYVKAIEPHLGDGGGVGSGA